MDPAKLKTALDALTDLVRDVLASEGPDRFARAAALSTLTSKVLLHGTPLRVKDAKRLMRNQWGNPGYDAPEFVDAQGIGYLQGDGVELQPIGPAYTVPTPGAVQGDVYQGIMGPVMTALGPVLAAQARSNQASELTRLIQIRLDLQGTEREHALDARIDELTDALAASTKETSNADVVPAEPVRGHPPGVAGEEPNEAHDLRPVAPGEGGDDSADSGGGEGAGAGLTLEPRPVSPFRSRLDQGTDGGAERADLESAEGAHEAPEAEPGADQRGEVRGRQDGGDDGAGAGGGGKQPLYERYRGLDHTGKAIYDPPAY